eukprot:m.44873 g.44873  ORF g.44873 m.44873 type:complete len:389 (-) comp17328_c0_seq1:119-1285(-)
MDFADGKWYIRVFEGIQMTANIPMLAGKAVSVMKELCSVPTFLYSPPALLGAATSVTAAPFPSCYDPIASVALCGAMLVYQVGRWWRGDLTTAQFSKISLTVTAAGAVGFGVSVIVGGACGAAIGSVVPVAGTVVGFAIGALVGYLASVLVVRLLNKAFEAIWPADGDEEELNRRNTFVQALATLGVKETDNFQEVKQKYNNFAKDTHPDKVCQKFRLKDLTRSELIDKLRQADLLTPDIYEKPDCDLIRMILEPTTKKFLAITTAWEIIRGFRQHVKDNLTEVGVCLKDLSQDQVINIPSSKELESIAKAHRQNLMSQKTGNISAEEKAQLKEKIERHDKSLALIKRLLRFFNRSNSLLGRLIGFIPCNIMDNKNELAKTPIEWKKE